MWRMVRSVADGTIAVRACHLEVGARRAADLVRVAAHAVGTPLLGEPLGDRLPHPRVATPHHRGGPAGRGGGGRPHATPAGRPPHPPPPRYRPAALATPQP